MNAPETWSSQGYRSRSTMVTVILSLNGFLSSSDVGIRVRWKSDGTYSSDEVTRVGVAGNSSAKVGNFDGIESVFIAGWRRSREVLASDPLIVICAMNNEVTYTSHATSRQSTYYN
ncbi:hypothetical protein ON010_g1107 [Phytophthora cinnamomi]|nr:hypothetical protein ON010_g1107 [Phytophthora cinnamomi]